MTSYLPEPLRSNRERTELPADLVGATLPCRDARERHFATLAAGECPPIIVVSGLPGTGKTTLLQFLAHENTAVFTPTTRFMPRERRPSDTAGDKPWTFGDGAAGDLTEPHGIIFSNVKYQGYYGFPGADVCAALKRGEIPVMLVTSYVEMVQLTEALHNLLPAVPVVQLRMEVPQEVLPARLLGRAGAHPDEHRERIAKISDLAKADMLQTPLLHKVYGTRVVWNLKPVEIEEFGYCARQISALSPAVVTAIVNDAASRAKDRASGEAQDILKVRQLRYGNPVVPDAVIDVLDNTVLRQADELLLAGKFDGGESAIVIKAGLAAAIYLGPNGRPVSPDIDFTLVESPGARLQMEVLMEGMCGTLPPWTDGMNKAVYHCDGLKGEARGACGSPVELDAILTTRVQPHRDGFCFVCTHDEHDLFHRRTVQTPAGNRFSLVPPEQLCIEKLVAGRGPDINKFDLFDASGLLATYPLNPSLVKKMVELQRFDPVLDAAAGAVLAAGGGALTDEVLERVGITEPSIRAIVRTLGPLIEDSAAPVPSEERTLTRSALKQFAFLSAVERSLRRIEAICGDEIFPVGDAKVSIGGRFGAAEVLQGVAKLRAQVMLHAGYYVGTNDTFVRRALGAKADEDRFFAGLEEQRRGLTPRLSVEGTAEPS